MSKYLSKVFISGLALTLLINPYSTLNVNAEDKKEVTNSAIEEAKNKLDSLVEKENIKKEDISNLEHQIQVLKDEKEKLTNKLNYLLEHLDKKESEVVELNKELSALRNGIEETKLSLLDREEEFKLRLNQLYKEHMQSDTKLIDVVLKSEGFFDLINNITSYKKIVEKDNLVVTEYIELIKKLETDTKTIEELVIELNEKIEEVKGLLEDVEETINEKAKVEVNLNYKLVEANKELENLKDEKESTEELINRLIEEEKNRISAKKESNKSSSKGITYNELEELKFSGDEEFLKYQKSINWALSQLTEKEWNDYNSIIEKYSKERGLPTALIKGIIMTESSFKKDTTNVNTNGTIDRGLMQMNSGTAPGVAAALGLTYEVGMEFIPETNIKMATYYISQHYTPENLHKGLSTYNRGPTGAKRWYEKHGTYVTPYSEKVIGYMKVFIEQEKNNK